MRGTLVLVALLMACSETNPNTMDGGDSGGGGCIDLSTPQGYLDALKCPEGKSCVLACSGTCQEPETPYACPAMDAWSNMQHAPACGSFDGKTFPAPVPGQCTATMPTGDALRLAGNDPMVSGRLHLPSSHFIQPVASEQLLTPKEVRSAFTLDLMLVPGTRFAIVIDAGLEDNAMYSVDLDLVAAGKPGLVATVKFPVPAALDFGLAFVAPSSIYASGGANGVLYAMQIDSNGVLTRDAAKDVPMGPSGVGKARWYPGAIAVSADQKTLAVAPAIYETDIRLVDVATKKVTPSVALPADATFDFKRDASDAYWLADMGSAQLLQIDLAKQSIVAKLPAGKNPEGIAFMASDVVVSASDSDTLTVFDASGKLVQTLDVRLGGFVGAQPSTLAFDAVRNRLYATLSGINALGVYAFDGQSSTPLSPIGEIPTAWWPTGLALRADGSLVVVTAKGHGVGPALTVTGPGQGGDTAYTTRGSIAVIPPPDANALAQMTAIVAASRKATPAEGYPTVTCTDPDPKKYDFPIPLTNTGDPSTRIKNIVYIVRENKTYDAVFGDLPSTMGEPSMVMVPGRMDEIWANARSIAKTFVNFDNFYVQAEQSLQGHIWTTFGRSTDFIERTWSSTWGSRGGRLPMAGIDPVVGSPAEGSLFLWAERNKLPYVDCGEIVGVGSQSFDTGYPGILYSMTVPDVEKACYLAARSRALCDLPSLTYVVLPNDHTVGLSPNQAAPEVFCAVNDTGTGMIIDALSHSPMWPQTLVIVTEDDPQDGADHVDGHRTLLFMASPWVKRGFVSHTKIDTAAIHKLIAHVFAKPYQSESVADAAIPYDAFTSTPDYTPYTHIPMKTRAVCNPSMDVTHLSDEWDFAMPDNQPGLSKQIMEHMRSLAH